MNSPESAACPVVGIDIGGTKTHLRSVLSVGPRDIIIPSASWRTRDWERDAAHLLKMTAQLTGNVEPAAIGIGAHGCDDDEECDHFAAAFRAQTDIPVHVVNDAELMPLAAGFSGQIGLVAGTGSVAVARAPAGNMLIAGGWGWVIGDEGSAAGLMREAVRAVALHLDTGGSRDEPLVKRVFGTLNIPRPARIGSAFAQLGSASEAGRHARVIFEAADLGSELAGKVIRDGGASLAQLVVRLENRGSAATHVIVGGSVIVSQRRLWRAFCDELRILFGDRIKPVLFDGEPVEGAIRLGERVRDRTEIRR